MSFSLSRFHQYLDIPKVSSGSFGVYRAIYFLWLSFYFLFENRVINAYPLFPLNQDPHGVYLLFSPAIFALEVVQVVYVFFIASLILSCIGLFTRVALISSCVLGFWLIGNSMAAGILSHQQFPHLLMLLIFAFSGGGKEFSVDRFFKKTIDQSDDDQVAFILLRSTLIIIFFSAGLSKLLNGGIFWYIDGNISDIFARANLWFFGFNGRELFGSLNVLLVENPWLGKYSSIAVFLVELFCPLAFFRGFKWPVVTFLALFQIGATMLLFVDFESFISLYLFWFVSPIRPEALRWKR